jgi:transcriptional regulator with XRE-family HTH domain
MNTLANTMSVLGGFLQRYLVEHSLTYADVQARTGVSKTTISEIINDGTKPSLPTLDKLARGLKLSLGRLMDMAGYDLDLDAMPDVTPRPIRQLTDADRAFIDGLSVDELREFIDFARRQRDRYRS